MTQVRGRHHVYFVETNSIYRVDTRRGKFQHLMVDCSAPCLSLFDVQPSLVIQTVVEVAVQWFLYWFTQTAAQSAALN